MSGAQKSEWPVAAGQIAKKNTRSRIIAAAEEAGNTDKVFATLRAQFALRGQGLHRTDPGNCLVTYGTERWGLVRYLPTLHDAALFLAQIGGAHE